ncbi:glycosyltransferase [Dubosiella muris]|uniref:Glycosyltransferase family 8 protein n=1 Tax=Dubosiella muris TaxID=3038133 RepID=A0AC61R522_9FIRM|nr:glycosyltransferase [Dubosiella muris]TGY65019.1 glycosyltransferase family 8 protein [Dubosiella muris]
MNVLYCGDIHIAQGLILSVLSLKNHVSEPLHVYILTMSLRQNGRQYEPIDAKTIQTIEKIVHQGHSAGTVEVLDVTALFCEELPEENMETRFTPYCMLRLYADRLALPDRILYLDTDVLCRRSPRAFYEQDMTGIELAGVLDHYGKWFFHRKMFQFDYMNSGVLLLNLEQIRKTGLFARARSYCRRHSMFMPDQSALNKLVRSKRLWPRRYNEQRQLQDDTVFQHFTTSFRAFPVLHTVSVKPWNREGMHDILHLHEYDGLYAEYDAFAATPRPGKEL